MMLLIIIVIVLMIVLCVIGYILILSGEKRSYYKLKKMRMQDFGVLVCKYEGGRKQVNIAQVFEVLSVTRKLIKEQSGEDIYEMMRSKNNVETIRSSG